MTYLKQIKTDNILLRCLPVECLEMAVQGATIADLQFVFVCVLYPPNVRAC